ncbi:MAG: hypothetical protein IK152_09370 [Lachnospiraceae bacterium]|nr:hypothetical protein [Lachnospiraceae bacterium]MBR5338180.1 hypothetical protein [Lachnospiraceae bacterium]
MDRKRSWAEGSFTVEASFIVPFCFFAIFTVMYFCFYLSNAAIATGIIERHIGKQTYQGGELETKVGQVRQEMAADLDKALVAMKSYDLQCDFKGNKMKVKFKGRMFNPVGIVKDMELEVSGSGERPMPVEFIRNVRRVKALI